MIIVTGGAGFIGSNIIRKLNEMNMNDILIVDDFKTKCIYKNLIGLKFNDIIDYTEFFNYYLYEYNLKDVECIIHEGACSDTTNHDAEYMLNINYIFTKQLIDMCINNRIKLIYASSASIYGTDQHCVNEAPINTYGFSKLLIDNYARQKYDISKSSIVGLRYFNVYGFGESNKGRMASVPYHLFQQYQNENKTIKLFEGSNNFYRDFIYIDDIVDITLFFALHKEVFKLTVDCGTGKPQSFQELGEIAQSNLFDCEIQHIPFPEDLKDQYQVYTKANLRTLQFVEYNTNFTSLEDGIKKYYDKLKTRNR